MAGVNRLATSASNSALSVQIANQTAAGAPKTAASQPTQPSASVAATPANTVSNATSAAITTLTAQPPATNASEASSESTVQLSAANNSGTADESLAQLATSARATLNANLASMAATGNPIDWNHATQNDWNTAFAGLDENSLYAIASNTGGLFSSGEQEAAYSLMVQPLTQAMGLNDPASFLASPAATAAGYAAGMNFMETFSPQVQDTPFWQVNMASLLSGYRDASAEQNSGDTPLQQSSESASASIASSNPVVELLADIIQNAKGTSFSVFSNSFISNLNQIPLFAQHSAELQEAAAQLSATDSTSTNAF